MGYLLALFIFLWLAQAHKCVVMRFKIGYYKRKLENAGIKSSVEDVKNVFDVIKMSD